MGGLLLWSADPTMVSRRTRRPLRPRTRSPGRAFPVQGRTWKGSSAEDLAIVRDLLVRRGATPDKELTNSYELWRVRIERVVFTAYTSGTLYCNGGNLPEMSFLYESISEILGVDGVEISDRGRHGPRRAHL